MACGVVSTTTRTRSTALQSGTANVLGGTAWLWARPEFASAVDVLFVDEAGQMSLANVLAVVAAPQQPRAARRSAAARAAAEGQSSGGRRTCRRSSTSSASIRRCRPIAGIFLPETWRLAPSICAFTSEVFYEGRLRSKPGLERQRLVGAGAFEGSGPVGGRRRARRQPQRVDEEVEVVDRLVDCACSRPARSGSTRTGDASADDRRATSWSSRPTTRRSAGWRSGSSHAASRVGTVDKFQGQEAPVVIYSMATSSPEDAPRGMEFLYSLNRLNVATSRARCAVFLVASPRLFEPECRTPRQMKLANALCRYREMARTFDGAVPPSLAREKVSGEAGRDASSTVLTPDAASRLVSRRRCPVTTSRVSLAEIHDPEEEQADDRGTPASASSV